MIPKLSAPLIKDIRTGEGLAEYVVGAGIAALGACQDLSFGKTAAYLTILAGAKGLRRGLLKLVAVGKDVGIGDPISMTGHQITGFATKITHLDPGAVLADIETGAKAIAAYQNETFTGDPAAVTSALSPSKVRAASSVAVPPVVTGGTASSVVKP